MKQLIHEDKNCSFWVTDSFTSNMLTPIIKNILYKAENCWDDYDELYHCCQLIELVRKTENIKMDFHYIKKEQDILGICLVTHGLIDLAMFFPKTLTNTEDPKNILVLNYFHIEVAGRGLGEHWLRNIILPYYKNKKFTMLYVKSSHQKVFSLYGRLGVSIDDYESTSDNNLYKRSGKIFKITL